jgi:hypothetical protein
VGPAILSRFCLLSSVVMSVLKGVKEKRRCWQDVVTSLRMVQLDQSHDIRACTLQSPRGNTRVENVPCCSGRTVPQIRQHVGLANIGHTEPNHNVACMCRERSADIWKMSFLRHDEEQNTSIDGKPEKKAPGGRVGSHNFWPFGHRASSGGLPDFVQHFFGRAR